MNQERRSFLRRAVGVLLAPLGIIPAMKSVKSDVDATIITFPDNTQLCFFGELPYHFRCEVIYDGFVVDEKGRKWAKWRPILPERLT